MPIGARSDLFLKTFEEVRQGYSGEDGLVEIERCSHPPFASAVRICARYLPDAKDGAPTVSRGAREKTRKGGAPALS